MVKVALIGAGKMGISHLAILGAHPDVQVVGVCDVSKMVLDVMDKYTSFPTFTDHEKMMEKAKPDAVFVSVPTKFHYKMVKDLLNRKIHVFAEKPLCLNPQESAELVKLAALNQCVNQVGYHNKFVGTFREVKRIVKESFLGDIYHFAGEAYGPVVVKKKQDTWRSDPSEGGGCLMDYASHVIDLINDILAPVVSSQGSLLKPVFSANVEDTVYSLLDLSSNVSGVLSVNWSDDTYRKMSTSITVIGTQGKIISDANELKVFFKGPKIPDGYSKGWNVKYITDLTEEVDFFLRGEEYSAQIDYFVKACHGTAPNTINTFQSAWQTDNAISIIKNSSK
jgi:predicted dehydrogenase